MDNIQLSSKNIGLQLYWATQIVLIAILLGHIFLSIIAPFNTVYPLFPVWSLLALFLAVFAISSRLTLGFKTSKPTESTELKWLSKITSKRLIYNLVVISTIGVCLHIFAKYYLTTIRPISCLFEIRFAWLDISHDLLPWYIRTASILGHLLSSFSYFGMFASSLALMLTLEQPQTKKIEFFYIFIFMFIGTIYAGFIGSRNVVLAYFIMAFAGTLIGLCIRQDNWKKSYKSAIITLIFPLLIAAGFSSAVFSNRTNCSSNKIIPVVENITANDAKTTTVKLETPNSKLENNSTAQKIIPNKATFYLNANCKGFAIECEDISPNLRIWAEYLSRWCPPCGSMVLYLNHGAINFSQILVTDERGAPVLFSFFRSLPKRFNITPLDFTTDDKISRPYGAGGTTLAGGAYHDYGIIGLLLTACIIGAAYGFALRLINNNNKSLFGICIFITLFYILTISNIFVGSNVISFPFILFSSGISVFIMTIKRKNNEYTG